jgi:hypothetical protein
MPRLGESGAGYFGMKGDHLYVEAAQLGGRRGVRGDSSDSAAVTSVREQRQGEMK